MENERINKLDKQIDKLADRLESMRIAEYIDLLQKPSKIIYLNFLAGISKGLGIAVGATIVFAILIDLLSRLIVLNLPVIGDFIVQILHIIEAKQGNL
ncbi:DUF5665 domain-containing protein [Anaerosinus gibii]|uniref:DUF5665 domain-containing protein n=1 Tax=Selenobaculum gibii TaxID=3054208 RepID=A0A9Y2AL25_9FIRM|nr:DUF5665 domain-containing protein [Selenobaculum gbiensis]WIW71818.1 DUF5665 domain-containing protein [Selenobaculum gbiensis]